MNLHNVDVTTLEATRKELERDPSKAKRVNRVEGTWNAGEGAQFAAEVAFDQGKVILQADQPTFQGGGGRGPSPMLYCLYGLASCFASTFATVAAMEGVPLKRLKVAAESRVDFSRAFGLGKNPPIEGARLTLTVESEGPPEKIREIEELARQRCPAVYCLTNPIPLETQLVGG